MNRHARMRGLCSGLVLVLAAAATQASQVRPVNLEQMSERAATIFSGVCLETSVTLHPELRQEVTTAKFEVHRAVKGDPGPTVTIRMLGDATSSTGSGLAGMPRFRPGDEVVLFLYGESSLGLTSPVGLGQGRFNVFTDKEGRRIAVNDLANKNLMRGISTPARSRLGEAAEKIKGRRELDPNELLDMAESLVTPSR